MDSLTDLKEKLAEQYRIDYGPELEIKIAWDKGFDAAMELQLPVLFAEYIAIENWERIMLIGELQGYRKVVYGKFVKKFTKDLYKYWRENIYQPE